MTDPVTPYDVNAQSSLQLPDGTLLEMVVPQGTQSTDSNRHIGTMLGISDQNGAPITQNIQNQIDSVSQYDRHQADSIINGELNARLQNIQRHMTNLAAQKYAEADTPEKQKQVVEDTKTRLGDVDLSKATSADMKALLVAAYTNNPEMNDLQRAELYRQFALMRVTSYMKEKFPYAEEGFLDAPGNKTLDFIGNFFSFRKTYQQWKAGMGIGDLEQQQRNFALLSYEERLSQLDTLLESYNKMAGGNARIFEEYALGLVGEEHRYNTAGNLIYNAIDATIAVDLAPLTTKLIRAASVKLTPVELLARTGSTPKAGELAAEAAADSTGAAGEAAGVDQVEALIRARPFNVQDKVYSGLSVATQAGITKILKKVQPNLRKLIYDGGNTWIEHTALTPAEQEGVISKYMEQFAGDAAVVQRDPYGFVVEVRTYKPATSQNGEMTELTHKRVDYRQNDIGTFETTEYTTASKYVNSPQFYINQIMKGAVEEATLINQAQYKIAGLFNQSLSASMKVLGKKRWLKVNSILQHGNLNKVARYSSIDLHTGIMTKDGLIRLDTAEELAAYHGMRDIFDTAYILQNRATRNQLRFDGYKAIHVVDGKSGEKTINFFRDLKGLNTVPEGVTEIWDNAAGKAFKVGDPAILARRLEQEEIGLVKLKFPYEAKNGRKYTYVLAPWKHAKELPDIVLQYRPGYVPNLWKDVNFVAIEKAAQTIDGVQTTANTVRRFFDSETEAKQFQKWMKDTKNTDIEIRPGKEYMSLSPGAREEYEQSIFGGMYVGQRSEAEIKMGLAGTPLEHIGATQALEANITHISHLMPINEWRMGMIKRFLNSAKNDAGESVLEKPWDWRSPIDEKKLPKLDRRYDGLTAMRTWLEDQFKIPTAEERMWANVGVKITRILDNESLINIRPVNAVRKAMMRGANQDMVASLRGASFHALLGLYNPRQFYAQAMGASAAFSMNPALFAKVFPKYWALRFSIAHFDNPEFLAKVASATMMNKEHFINMVQAFEKAGIRDAVLSSADYKAAVYGHGITKSTFSRVFDWGMIPFKEGELFARMYSWIQAYETQIIRKGITRALTDKEIDMVTKESLRIGQNYTRANRAYWQKGVLSIPTQFQQVTTKFYENLFYPRAKGGGWTPRERVNVMLGQLLLFGTAGAALPFGTSLVKHMRAWMQSDDEFAPHISDEKTIVGLTQGLMGLAVYGAVGEPMNVSENLSYTGNTQQFIERIMDIDTSAGKLMSAAVGSVGTRAGRALSSVIRLFAIQDNFKPEFLPEQINIAATEITDIASSISNAHKAFIIAQSSTIYDSKGNPVKFLEEPVAFRTALAQAMGLQPQVIEDTFELKQFNKNSEEAINDVVNMIVALQRKYYSDPDQVSETKWDLYNNEIRTLEMGMSDATKAKVNERVLKHYNENNGAAMKELLKALDNVISTEKASPELELNTTLSQKEDEE